MFSVQNRGWMKAAAVLAMISGVGLASPAIAGHERDGRVVETTSRITESTTRVVETTTRWREEGDRGSDARRDERNNVDYKRGHGRRDDDWGRDRHRERDRGRGHGWDHHGPRCEPPPRCAPPPRCEPPRVVCPPRRVEGIGIGIRIGVPGVIIIGDATSGGRGGCR